MWAGYPSKQYVGPLEWTDILYRTSCQPRKPQEAFIGHTIWRRCCAATLLSVDHIGAQR
jgi:hypothetical protein